MTSSYDSGNTFYDKSLSDATSKGELNKQSQVYVYLANKYGGLYIDIDDLATNSTRAKIEAFLELR